MSTESTIQALLSDNDIKWFPLVAPHDEPAPFVVYQEIPSNENLRTHDKTQEKRNRWQLVSWAYTYDEARQLRDRLEGLFDLNTVNFEFASTSHGPDLPDPDSGLYRKILEVYLWE